MAEIFRAFVALALGATGVLCLIFAYQIFRGNGREYERNRHRIGGIKNVLSGKVATVADGGRDYRIAAGIAIDRNKNEWVEQGKLSSEALLSALRRPC